jgi:hypothetical protein
MEVPGANIVLWEDFWRIVSVLIETQDLEQALEGRAHKATAEEGGTHANARMLSRSDSDIARELQAQFDMEGGLESKQERECHWIFCGADR